MLGSNACWPASRSDGCCKIPGIVGWETPGSIVFTWNNPKTVETRLTSNEHEYDCILASWLKWEVYSMLPWKNYCMIAPNMHSNMQNDLHQIWTNGSFRKHFPSNQPRKTLLETQPPWCLLQRGFLIRTSSPVTRTSLRCAKRWVLRKVNDKFVKRPNRMATMELPARSCFHHSRPTSTQFGTFGDV